MALDVKEIQHQINKEKLKSLRYEIWKLKESETNLLADNKISLAIACRIMLQNKKKEYARLKEVS